VRRSKRRQAANKILPQQSRTIPALAPTQTVAAKAENGWGIFPTMDFVHGYRCSDPPGQQSNKDANNCPTQPTMTQFQNQPDHKTINECNCQMLKLLDPKRLDAASAFRRDADASSSNCSLQLKTAKPSPRQRSAICHQYIQKINCDKARLCRSYPTPHISI
jgi:hypothetical protein